MSDNFRNLPIEDRFWSRVHKSKNCWNWTGSKTRSSHGYGHIKSNKNRLLCHRFSWELHNGKIPSGIKVLHKCDNTLCVRPEHLFLGTQKDNILDMVKKKRHWTSIKPESIARGERSGAKTHPERIPRGARHGLIKHPERAARGERVGSSKLKEHDIVSIRKLYKTGNYTIYDLSNKFGVKNGHISRIINKKCWAHVSD